MKSNNKLKGKDLINIGIYAAIYCVIMMCIAMLGYIPILMPMLCVIGPIILGVPMMLFYTKVRKFGMISILAIVVGIFLCVTGMGFWPVLFSIAFGVLADLIAKSGGYASTRKTILSYGTFCVLIFGNYVPLYLDPVGYFSTRQSFGTEYINTLSGIMQPWTAPVLVVAAFVCGILGALLGKALLKKHFVKAGIA